MRRGIDNRVREIYAAHGQVPGYKLIVRVYGRDGVMGPLEPLAGEIPHEVGILFEITASDMESARGIASTFSHFAIHYPIPEWGGLISGLAYPFAPAELEKGPVYRFNVNHIVFPDTPCEMFPMELVEVGA